MNCPECGFRTEVVKTTKVVGGRSENTQRLRECKCGVRIVTEERIVKRLPVVTGGLPVVARGRPQPTGNPPATVGGSGGGVSSGLFPDPDLDPGLVADPNRARARSRSGAIEYPAEFLAFWKNTPQTGSKYKALKAWIKFGRPSSALLVDAWKRWGELDQWRRGIIPHVVTWLNGRCWEQEPKEVPRHPPPANGFRSQRPEDWGYPRRD